MNIAIIPARGGSRRIPGKNIRNFHGQPIIAYSIAVAQISGLFSKVVVSTADMRITAVAKAYGAKIHARPRRLADDIAGTQAVMQNALQTWGAGGNRVVPETACCIYATAPMLTARDLGDALAALENHTYVYVPGLFYWGQTAAFLAGVPLETGIALPFPAHRYIDINTEDDWQRAEQMYAAQTAVSEPMRRRDSHEDLANPVHPLSPLNPAGPFSVADAGGGET